MDIASSPSLAVKLGDVQQGQPHAAMHGLSQTQQYCVQEAQKHNLVQKQSTLGPNIGGGCIAWQQATLTTDLMA